MKTLLILIALTGYIAAGTVHCIRIDEHLTICTDEETGEETSIWTY